jgi:hypothetical protein
MLMLKCEDHSVNMVLAHDQIRVSPMRTYIFVHSTTAPIVSLVPTGVSVGTGPNGPNVGDVSVLSPKCGHVRPFDSDIPGHRHSTADRLLSATLGYPARLTKSPKRIVAVVGHAASDHLGVRSRRIVGATCGRSRPSAWTPIVTGAARPGSTSITVRRFRRE